MIIKGQYTSTEIFTENIEEAALQWVKEQCDHPAFEGGGKNCADARCSCR